MKKYFNELKHGDIVYVQNICTVAKGLELNENEREEVLLAKGTRFPVVYTYSLTEVFPFTFDKGNDGDKVLIWLAPPIKGERLYKTVTMTKEQYTKCDVFFIRTYAGGISVISTSIESLKKGIKKALNSIMLFESNYMNVKLASLSEIHNSL